jgi:hypothetical protein
VIRPHAGKKCVRGVPGVDEKVLLTENPWQQFKWIEGPEKPIRLFDGGDLLSFLDYMEKKIPLNPGGSRTGEVAAVVVEQARRGREPELVVAAAGW